MNIAEALRKLSIEWSPEIEAATRRGDLKPLVESLRSEKPIPLHEERFFRDSLAAILARQFNRGRGRPRKRAIEKIVTAQFRRPMNDYCLFLNVNEVADELRALGIADPLAHAFELTAAQRNVSPDTMRRRYNRASKLDAPASE